MIREVLAEIDTDGPGPGTGGTYRPALRRLALDIEDLAYGNALDGIPSLAGGFDTRADIVRWEQRLAVRSLGNVPQYVYQGIASQLAAPEDRPLIQALLNDPAMDERTAAEWRQRVRKRVVMEAGDRAFRRLRLGATEYIDDADEGDEHDPEKQVHIAMRPSLDELDQWQEKILDRLLDGGLDDRDAILDWASVLEHATHGEPIQVPDGDDIPVGEFAAACHEKEPFVDLLTRPKYDRVRVTWAARYLIPTFNAGVRDIFPASSELPKGVPDQTEREPDDWA